jgi:Uncharacterized protein conserved in bacteria
MRDSIRASLLKFLVASNPKYIPTKFHIYLANLVQDRVEKGGARLCVSVPPRHGKSEIISRGLPAWFLGHHNDAEIMTISHNSNLAKSFGKKVRAMMSSPFYAQIFPGCASVGSGVAGEDWETESGGIYKGEGVDGSITGFGGDLLLIDDIVKNRKQAHSPAFQKQTRDTFGSTLFTRLEPDATLIIINTRWTANDLIGFTAGELGWEYVNLPAIALENDPMGRLPGEALCPDRYDIDALLEKKSILTPYDWESLYQGIPPDEVKNQTYKITPEDLTPLVGVWTSDRVLLFNGEACTHIGAAETLSELETWLETFGGKQLPVFCSETGVANHPHTKEVLPNLAYHPLLDGYLPPVTLSFPIGAITPRDIQAARYYMTLPKVAEYKPGRLGLGMLLGRPPSPQLIVNPYQR